MSAEKHKPPFGRNVPAKIQRRILEHLNQAVRPEDLRRDVDPKADVDVFRSLFEARESAGAFGFRRLDELVAIAGINQGLFDRFVAVFGRATRGEWATPYETQLPDDTPYHVAHAAVMKTGKVLFLPEASTKTTLLWDPSDEVNPLFEFMIDTPDEMLFCSGHTHMSDGRLLVVGGGGGGPSGVNRAWKFNPDDKSWVQTAGNMSQARWYPTAVNLGDERRILVVGGAPSNDTSDVYDETTDTFVAVTGAGSTRSFPQLYPGLHLLPGGEVFYTRTGFGSAGPGPGGSTDPLDTNSYFVLDPPSTGKWTELAIQMEEVNRVRGMSVVLVGEHGCPFRILVAGGGVMPGSETAEIVNLSLLNPVWEHPELIPGGEGRTNVNAVALPDGTALVVGGTASTTVPCALYRPEGGWAPMDNVNYRKQYHSVAVLLPSGKVAATGGSNFGGGSNVIEIFSPPYLFKSDGTPAAQPEITSAPAMVHHGADFQVKCPQADDIRRASLVRPMAVTHQTDTCQRAIPVFVCRDDSETVTVTAPNHHHPHGLAPRGYYMLFLIDKKGVPSEGKFIHLH